MHWDSSKVMFFGSQEVWSWPVSQSNKLEVYPHNPKPPNDSPLFHTGDSSPSETFTEGAFFWNPGRPLSFKCCKLATALVSWSLSQVLVSGKLCHVSLLHVLPLEHLCGGFRRENNPAQRAVCVMGPGSSLPMNTSSLPGDALDNKLWFSPAPTDGALP